MKRKFRVFQPAKTYETLIEEKKQNKKEPNKLSAVNTTEKTLHTRRIEKLQLEIDELSRDGNWNYSEYNLGRLNGMIYCMALFKGEIPKYFVYPDKWVSNDLGFELIRVESEKNHNED